MKEVCLPPYGPVSRPLGTVLGVLAIQRGRVLFPTLTGPYLSSKERIWKVPHGVPGGFSYVTMDRAWGSRMENPFWSYRPKYVSCEGKQSWKDILQRKHVAAFSCVKYPRQSRRDCCSLVETFTVRVGAISVVPFAGLFRCANWTLCYHSCFL